MRQAYSNSSTPVNQVKSLRDKRCRDVNQDVCAVCIAWDLSVARTGRERETGAEQLEVGFKKVPGGNDSQELAEWVMVAKSCTGAFMRYLLPPFSAALKATDHVFQYFYYAACPSARQIGTHH